MAAEAHPYQKLPGTGGGLFEVTRLYLAADHLLQVTSTGYSESYRRFYFRDIRAITLRRTPGGRIFNALFAGLALLFLAIALQSGAPVIWGIVASFFLVLLAFNALRGPTCACQIHTAVQSRKAGSLNRLHKARQVLERVRPRILSAQGELPPEEIARRLEQLRQTGFYTETATAPPEAGATQA